MNKIIDIAELKQKDIAYLIHPNTNLKTHSENGPLLIVRGEGSTVYDSEDNALIDSLGGLWNCCLGHGRKDVIRAISDQMEQIAFATTFQGISNEATIRWAEALVQKLPGDLNHVYPNVTGSEANDTAFKFTRMYFGLQGKPNKIKVFSHHRGYHGVATGVLSATGITDFWKRYMPLQGNFHHVPVPNCYRCPYGQKYPDCGELCSTVLEGIILAEDPDTVAAFIAEPVIGGGGVIIPPPNYYKRVREITEKNDIIFIADEIITGFGRTGTWFGVEHWDVVPDMMSVGKGMTGGYMPMFATAVRDSIYQTFIDSGEVLFHGFTYTGAPPLSVAALKTIQIIEEENLIERVNWMGKVFAEKLKALLEYPWVGDVRSLGLVGGIEFVADQKTKQSFAPELKFGLKFVQSLGEHGVLGRMVKGDILIMAPPFVITEAEMDMLFKGIAAAIEEVCPAL